MKVRDVLRRLADEGWVQLPSRGTSHRQFSHTSKPGKVTISGNNVRGGQARHIEKHLPASRMGVAVMGDSTFNASDLENDRLRMLGEMEAEYGPDWSRLNAPGSFGCHELLDRTHLIGDLVEESLLNHPACIRNPEWFAMASQAVELLRELYQRIGQDNPDVPQASDIQAIASSGVNSHRDMNQSESAKSRPHQRGIDTGQ